MADPFFEDNFKTIAESKGTCLSIYIPTHSAGMEVNAGKDRIAFKNEVQKLRNQLSTYEYDNRYIDNLLAPAVNLIDDLMFWKDLSEGLAVFIKEGMFTYFRSPIPFRTLSVISSRFIVTPIIELLNSKHRFFILSLNKYDFGLFSCNQQEIKEFPIEERLRKKAEEALIPFDSRNDYYEPVNENREGQVLQNTKVKGDVNIPAYFKAIDEILVSELKNFGNPPLMVAAIDAWQGDFRKVTKYKNIYEKSLERNVQFLSLRELHNQAKELMASDFKKPLKMALEKYKELAGSGKTSSDLEAILADVTDGRVDTLFIPRDTYIWGRQEQNKKGLILEERFTPGNYCLLNEAALLCFKNKGKLFLLDKKEMPEDSPAIAIYRY